MDNKTGEAVKYETLLVSEVTGSASGQFPKRGLNLSNNTRIEKTPN